MQHPTPPPASQAPSRLEQLRAADEDGAQAVEYAMIGGLGAGLISVLWTLLDKTGLVDKLLSSITSGLLDLISGWL